MIDLNMNYQVSLFGNFNIINATPECTFKLMSLFKDYNFIPNTFNEFPINMPLPIINQVNSLRPMLRTVNGEWSINIGSQRLDIMKTVIDKEGNSIGHIESFILEATKYLTILIKEFCIMANRLALNTNGFCTNDKCFPFTKVIKPIDFYEKNNPTEWNVRMITRDVFKINNKTEKVNIITSLNKARVNIVIGGNEAIDFYGTNILFDINTVPEDVTTRFEDNSVRDFLNQSYNCREAILYQMKEKYK